MDNHSLLHNPGHDPRAQRDVKAGLLIPRRQILDEQYPEAYEEPGQGLLVEYLRILRRHKGTMILITSLGLLSALAYTLPQTPIYQAHATLEIQNLNENFLNMHDLSPTADASGSQGGASDLNTQIKILQSQSLLDRVVEMQDFGKRLYPESQGTGLSAWRKALNFGEAKQGATRRQTLGLVSKNLSVTTEANTRLIDIRFDSTDPQVASDFVNALTTEYGQQNIESRWQTAKQTKDWLKQQTDDLQSELIESEVALQNYATESGLVFTDEKDNVADDQLRQIQGELSKAHGDRIIAQAKYELATKAQADALPQVLDDSTLKDYQVKLTDLRRQLAEITSSLTPAHPEVKKIQAQVTSMELAMVKERTNIVQRIRNEFDSAKRLEALITENYEQQARLMSNQSEKVTHYNILKHKVDTNRHLYDTLLQNVQQASMNSALGASNIRVVDPAKPPTGPYKPNLALNSALGLLSGVFFGMAFIAVRERADRSIRAPGEAEMYLDVPELGAIPSLSSVSPLRVIYHRNGNGYTSLNSEAESVTSPSEVELVVSSRKPSVLGDAFRAALTSILYSGENGNRPRVIVITSANPGEGKSTVACNLALALAEIGNNVLLVDSDLRKPRLHHVFGFHNKWGLTDLLKGRTATQGCEDMVYKTSYRNLSLLPSGALASNSSCMLHSRRAFELFRRMRKQFDTVIIDSPPLLQMPDARVLARFADGVVLVVHSARTDRDVAAAARRRLTDDGTRVLGTILNQWDPGKTTPYSYVYGYERQ